MSVDAMPECIATPGRGGIPLNPEDEEQEEEDNVRFKG